ncbi:hypothetical protein PsorP6_007490 [Peronosclerospora sorghi]|uniref:Uncharacterized protein n=1 Tax=Peronosclerospora sorghi TaxID=230839 RepID=A0ACC0W8E4_9STRA|nr:hypothetical protein PsorP6_007490 [Peronosclerospora sorghi]
MGWPIDGTGHDRSDIKEFKHGLHLFTRVFHHHCLHSVNHGSEKSSATRGVKSSQDQNRFHHDSSHGGNEHFWNFIINLNYTFTSFYSPNSDTVHPLKATSSKVRQTAIPAK